MGVVVAGVAMWVWGALSHMVFQLGDAGISALKNEAAVMTALGSEVAEDGLYLFPALDESVEGMEAADEAWQARYEQGPYGLLVITAKPGPVGMGKKLGIQLAIDILTALLVALLLVQVGSAVRSFWARVGFAASVGVAGGLAVLLPYWNWYHFPTTFVVAGLADRAIGFAIVGAVLAWFFRTSEA